MLSSAQPQTRPQPQARLRSRLHPPSIRPVRRTPSEEMTTVTAHDYETVRYELPEPAIARIVMNRPEARNAQNLQMTYDLNAAFDRAAQDDAVKVIILAGADPHEGDRLGRLKLTWDGLEARDRRVFDWAWQRRVPLAFAMAGGYGKRLEDTVQVQVNTFRVALDYWRRWQNLTR